MKTNKKRFRYEQKNVDLNDISIPDNLMRQVTDPGKLKELMESISDVGLINPITLIKINDKLHLKAGWRRFQVFQRLRKKTIPARIITTNESIGDQIMLDENLIRSDINIVDEAFWLAALQKKYKLTKKALAQKINKSETFAAERLKILEMDEELLAYLQNEMITLANALLLQKCDNLNDRKQFLMMITENGATEKVVREWVNRSNFELQQKGKDLNEEEFIETEHKEYTPPETFCDICETKTSYMNAKFVRMCPDCLKISKANLSPEKKDTE